MIVKEFRIALPMELDEYEKGLLWSVAEASKNETGGGEGVEVVEQYDFENEEIIPEQKMSGNYTRKIYRIKSKCPWVIQKLLHPESFELHEESWNCFPYIKTVLTNPKCMKDNFSLCIESIHLQDDGTAENPLNGPPKREIVYIDICDDSQITKPDYAKETDPKFWHSEEANRGPLERDWLTNGKQPVMYAYKLVSIQFKWRGLQKMVEKQMQKAYPRIFTKFNRECVCWMDKWHSLSMESIREFEEQVTNDLKEQLNDRQKRGSNFHDAK